MTRRLGPDEERLWQALTASIAPEPQAAAKANPRIRPGARRLKPDEERLWQAVTGAFYPTPLRPMPPGPSPAKTSPNPERPAPPLPATAKTKTLRPPQAIEPGRTRLISRTPQFEARLDLHGLDQDRARAVLNRFIVGAYQEGYRAALVITGKGLRGDGVLRQRVPEWLASPALRHAVAGISPAHRRHGGDGALYVALKRHPQA